MTGAVSAAVGGMRLAASLGAPDLVALARAARAGGLVPDDVPTSLSVGWVPRPPTGDWFERWVAPGREEVTAKWAGPPGERARMLHLAPGSVVKIALGVRRDARAALELLSGLPFTVAAFDTVYEEWLEGPSPYAAPSFAELHYPLGWGCAFRGEGHERLVSRRWLECGPWRVLRGAGDTTLVQFHDLAADAETALAEARPGHQRMGITDGGGYLQRGYVYTHELRGFYVAGEGLLKVIVHGRELSPLEMRDACAARQYQALGPDRPLRRVAYVFMEEGAARAQLRELWCRELECWAIVDGAEVRLDADYRPDPERPAWVRRVDGG